MQFFDLLTPKRPPNTINVNSIEILDGKSWDLLAMKECARLQLMQIGLHCVSATFNTLSQ
jgi:hypothetical protein